MEILRASQFLVVFSVVVVDGKHKKPAGPLHLPAPSGGDKKGTRLTGSPRATIFYWGS